MFGILNIHKPSGMTSRDAVNCVQKLIRPAKVGHAGTLDPLANGVLVLCVGPATRLIAYVQKMPKSYRGTFLLGCESDTEDVAGSVKQLADANHPSLDDIQSLLPEFTGQIMQRPPAYSALKVAGRRAYELARRGHEVILEPRPVQIHALRAVSYAWPQLVLDIECGSGTYVRSLGRDIAKRLGTAAVMSALTRTAIGDFSIDDALLPDELTKNNLQEHLLPAKLALASLPTVQLTDLECVRIRQGLTITDRFADTIPEPGLMDEPGNREISALAPSGDLTAILVPRRGGWGPVRNFAGSK